MNNMNFNPNMFNMINPQMMRTALGNIDNMSDDQLRSMLNSSGLKVDPQVYRQMAKQMSNSSDADLENMRNKSKDMFSNSNPYSNSPNSNYNAQPTNKNKSGNHNIDESQFTKKSHIEKLEAIKLQGNAFFKDGKYKEAKEKYYEMLNEIEYGAENKSDTRDLLKIARLNIANCHLKLEDYELVIHECNKILKTESNFKAFYRCGVAHFMKKRYDKSEECFNNAKQMQCTNEEKKQIENFLAKISQERPDINNAFNNGPLNQSNAKNSEPKSRDEEHKNPNYKNESASANIKSTDSKIVLNAKPNKSNSTVEKLLNEENKPEKKKNDNDEIKIEDVKPSHKHNSSDPNCSHNARSSNSTNFNNGMFEESKRRIENMVQLLNLG